MEQPVSKDSAKSRSFAGTIFYHQYVLSAKGYLMVYDQIMAMTEGGPGTSTTSIAVLIYKKGFGGGQFAYQSANAVMLFVVVVLISVFQLRVLEKREEKLG